MGISSPEGGGQHGRVQRMDLSSGSQGAEGWGGVCFLQKGLKNDGVQAETVASQNPGLKGLIGGPRESTRKYPPEQ